MDRVDIYRTPRGCYFFGTSFTGGVLFEAMLFDRNKTDFYRADSRKYGFRNDAKVSHVVRRKMLKG